MIVDTVALTKALKVEFNRAYIQAPGPKYDPLITRVPSTSNMETYGWMGDVPQIREWIGEKVFKHIKDYQYTIYNKNYEASISVDENEIEDDQAGIIMPRVQMLAQRAKLWPNVLISNLLMANGLAFDGAAFFSDRAINDNNLAGTGITEAQILADLAQARKAMMRFIDDYGEPLELEGDTIVCPPELEITFKKIIQSSTFITATAQGVANVWAGVIKQVVVDARLIDLSDWYLMCSQYPLKPFILQNRKNVQFVGVDKPDSETRFRTRRLMYSSEARYGSGYGYYQMAVRMVNT